MKKLHSRSQLPRKPRTVRIEMSSASTDEPFRSVALEVPIDSQGQATLHMNVAVQDSADSPASTEVAHPVGGMGSTMVGMVSPSAANMTLPPPAPHGLGDLWSLGKRLQQPLERLADRRPIGG